jgi:hypothetical protein
MTLMPQLTPARIDAPRSDLDLIGIVTAPPWSAVPAGLHLVPCGARAALFGPAAPSATAQEAVRTALDRMRLYETSGLIGRLLPVAAGARIPPAEVAAVLSAAEREIARAEDEVRGAAEYQVRVTWAEDRVLGAFRDTAELAPVLSARRVTAGEIARAVLRLSRRLAATMDEEFARGGFARVEQPLEPGMILNRAVLVPASALEALDGCLARIDALWSDGLAVKLIGPTPPVSFAIFDAVRVDPSRRRAAQALLGQIGATGAMSLAAARRFALRAARDANAASEIRDAVRDLSLGETGAPTGTWRLDRRLAAPTLPSAIVA